MKSSQEKPGKQYTIIPYVGFGEVRLGMTSEQISTIYKQEPKKYEELRGARTDLYDHFFVYYKPDGTSEAIEFFGDASVFYQGVSLLGEPYTQVRKAVLALGGSDIEEDGAGLITQRLGFGIYAPHAKKEPAEPTESVIIFINGYYDDLDM